MKQLIKNTLKKTPAYTVYRHIQAKQAQRKLVRRFFGWSEEDQQRLTFYRQFIKSGDIVFDIGANMGNRTKVFLKLGANVIAVEPQKHCADFLEKVLAKEPRFQLLRKAMGPCKGEAEILISTAHTISSFSPDWIQAVIKSGRHSMYEWNRKEKVTMDTLDNLITEYGYPAFIKIDVEGFEYEVISGLSCPVSGLSIEFHGEFLESTFKCIDHICRLSNALFQISFGESLELALPKWVTPEEMKRFLTKINPMVQGDIYINMQS